MRAIIIVLVLLGFGCVSVFARSANHYIYEFGAFTSATKTRVTVNNSQFALSPQAQFLIKDIKTTRPASLSDFQRGERVRIRVEGSTVTEILAER